MGIHGPYDINFKPTKGYQEISLKYIHSEKPTNQNCELLAIQKVLEIVRNTKHSNQKIIILTDSFQTENFCRFL